MKELLKESMIRNLTLCGLRYHLDAVIKTRVKTDTAFVIARSCFSICVEKTEGEHFATCFVRCTDEECLGWGKEEILFVMETAINCFFQDALFDFDLVEKTSKNGFGYVFEI